MRDWTIAAVGLTAALLLLVWGRGATKPKAEPAAIAFTVVPSDADNLDCRGSFRLDGARCRYDATGQLAQGDRGSPAPLRPFMTVNRELLLLSGVFEQPSVASWLTEARGAGATERVTIDCLATPLGVVEGVDIRWQAQAPWSPEREVAAARVASCKRR